MVVRIITRNVLGKGQVVIPKTIRDMLGIHKGDELVFDVQDERIILSKKVDVVSIFEEISELCDRPLTVKQIKRELRARYGDE